MYDNYSKLLGLMNRLFRKDLIAGEICRSAGKQLDCLEADVNDLRNQFFLDTATWALDIFEGELGIDTVKAKPLSDRRSAISAKWRGTGKLTLDLIKRTVDAYINGDADVRFTGRIEIEFSCSTDCNPDIEDVYNSIWEIKPAHLPLAIKSRRLLPEAVITVRAALGGPVYTNRLDWRKYYSVRTPETVVNVCAALGEPVYIKRLDWSNYYGVEASGHVAAVSGPVGVYMRTRIGDDVS